MRRFVRSILACALAAPAVVGAQSAACPGGAAVNADACQKAIDLDSYLLPQLGLALAGGNPVLGSSKVLGKLGHFNVGLRGTVFNGGLPQLDNVSVSTTGATASDIPVKKQYLGGPGVDAEIGLWGGIPVGVTHVGSVDALVSFIYIPDFNSKDNGGGGGGGGGDNGNLKFQSHTKFGFGARVGLIDESVVIPGVSVAYLKRGLPAVDVTSNPSNATVSLNGLGIDVSTWRIMATKSLVAFALSVGYGGDSYKASGSLTAGTNGVASTVSLDQTINRNNWFADLTINLGPAHLGFEYGGVSGGSINTVNTFDPAASASRTYYSAGLRFGW